jgi:hypothetical protein
MDLVAAGTGRGIGGERLSARAYAGGVANPCANHPHAPARHLCQPCGSALCDSCVHYLRDGKTAECARCGSLVVPFTGLVPARQRFERSVGEPPLIERLPGTVRWLGRRSVLFVLLAFAVFGWVLQLIPLLGFVFGWLIAGLSAALFFFIVEQTANGVDELDTPDFTDLWDATIGPLLRFLATMLPLFVGLWLGGLSLLAVLFGLVAWSELPRDAAVVLVAWIALWPLLIIVAALSRSFLAIYDPRVWWKTLAEMRGDYALAAVAFYAVFFFELLVARPLLFRLAVKVPVPFFVPVAVSYALLCLMAVRARILGEACKPYL